MSQRSENGIVLIGFMGTGKTTVLAERFVHLAEAAPPESLLALCHSAPAADALRELRLAAEPLDHDPSVGRQRARRRARKAYATPRSAAPRSISRATFT